MLTRVLTRVLARALQCPAVVHRGVRWLWGAASSSIARAACALGLGVCYACRWLLV